MLQERIRISEDIIQEFVTLFEMVRDSQFIIGDRLILLVDDHGGQKTEVIKELSGELGISASVLYDYYRIAERWTQDLRTEYQSLDWTIYRNADPVKDRELLDRAVDEAWTATRFKEEKFDGMREPSRIVGRIKSIIIRCRKYFDGRSQLELDRILERLERLIEAQS